MTIKYDFDCCGFDSTYQLETDGHLVCLSLVNILQKYEAFGKFGITLWVQWQKIECFQSQKRLYNCKCPSICPFIIKKPSLKSFILLHHQLASFIFRTFKTFCLVVLQKNILYHIQSSQTSTRIHPGVKNAYSCKNTRILVASPPPLYLQ